MTFQDYLEAVLLVCRCVLSIHGAQMGIEQPSHPGISRVFMYSASLLGSYLESYLNLLLSELTERGKNPAYTPSLVRVISSPVHSV